MPVTHAFRNTSAIFLGQVLIGAALTLAFASPSYACPFSELPLSQSEEMKVHHDDERIRYNTPKEYMALIEGRRGQISAMPWLRWTSLSPKEREKFVNEPDWEQYAWIRAHGNPEMATTAYGEAVRRWLRQGPHLLDVVGYGHYYREGGGDCEGNLYWSQKSFKVLWPNLTPRQSNGLLIAKLYGYRLPVSPLNQQFVVLSYQVCGPGAGDHGQCPISWWRRWFDY